MDRGGIGSTIQELSTKYNNKKNDFIQLTGFMFVNDTDERCIPLKLYLYKSFSEPNAA